VVVVQLANPTDLDDLVEMGRFMVHEAPNFQGKYDEERARDVIRPLLMGAGGVAFVSVEEEAEPGSEEMRAWFADHPMQKLYPFATGRSSGMILGWLATKPWSLQKYVADLALFVYPERRCSSVAMSLIKAWENWACASGAVESRLGISTGTHADRTRRFYEHLGYEVREFGMVKPLK
jgi:GNAT superfamily N-acetyltransferase